MARLNRSPSYTASTHEGGPAFPHLKPEQTLRRSVLSCLLWESEFYEDGEEIAKRIMTNAAAVPPPVLASLAMEARNRFHLRHVPLLLLSVLARTGSGSRLVSDTIARTIQRADELGEFVSIYAKINGVEPKDVKKKLSAQVKKGLARAFANFDAYQLAKYNRDAAIKLRDVAFLSHVRMVSTEHGQLLANLVNREYFPEKTKSGFEVKSRLELDGVPHLDSSDTWEVALSGGADKKETFERLIREQKLGYLALLRNLRNMEQASVDRDIVLAALRARKGAQRVLPFRYVAAARAAPYYEPALDEALLKCIEELPKLSGRSLLLIDVSGSMAHNLSERSDLTRMDAAATLASIVPGDRRTFTFSNDLVEVPSRSGMAGVDAIVKSQSHGGTYLGKAVEKLSELSGKFDRFIVITDEQSHDRVPTFAIRPAYMINVASNRNGVGYGSWVHIDGFSEHVLRFIHEYEASRAR